MLFFLTTQPLWVSGAILVVLTTALAMIGPVVVRRWYPFDRLDANNEIAGLNFTAVGVLYAVLLAFAIIVVWEKFSDAETTVGQEAGAAETIFRLSNGFDAETGADLRKALSRYLEVAVTVDWPAMNRGTMGGKTRSARQALDDAYAALLKIDSAPGRKASVLSEIMRQLDVISQARRARLIASAGTVPDVIWIILFGGAVLTIGFTFFFGMPSLLAQTVMTGLLSVLIFSELLAIVAIDRPFSGIVKVEPQALANVLELYTANAKERDKMDQH